MYNAHVVRAVQGFPANQRPGTTFVQFIDGSHFRFCACALLVGVPTITTHRYSVPGVIPLINCEYSICNIHASLQRRYQQLKLRRTVQLSGVSQRVHSHYFMSACSVNSLPKERSRANVCRLLKAKGRILTYDMTWYASQRHQYAKEQRKWKVRREKT